MMINTHKRIISALVVTIVSTFSFYPTIATALSSYELQSPFEQGTRWYVCQGYDNTSGSHTGSSQISLDFTGSQNCGSSAAGSNVFSPFKGVVSWYAEPSGSLCITETGAQRSVMLTHINSSHTTGMSVNDGDLVGHIAGAGFKQNNGSAHLHLQVWNGARCTSPAQNVPLAKSSSMKICGAPDMPIDGPRQPGVGIWGGVTFAAKQCAPDPAPIKQGATAIYRFWSLAYNHHFYTSSYDEMKDVYDSYDTSVWQYELQPFYTPTNSDVSAKPVYRFWSDQYKGHFYTSDESERQRIVNTYPSNVWRQESIVYYAYTEQLPNATRIPVYRFWSDQYRGHFYTISEKEKQEILSTYPSSIWNYEGVAFYTAP